MVLLRDHLVIRGGWDRAALFGGGDVEFSEQAQHNGNIWMDVDNDRLHGFFLRDNDPATPRYNRFVYNSGTDDWTNQVLNEDPGSMPVDEKGFHHSMVVDSNEVAWIIFYDFANNIIDTRYRTIAGSWTDGPSVRTTGDGPEPAEAAAAIQVIKWKDDDGVDAIGVLFTWDNDWGFAYRKDSAALTASWTFEIAYDGATTEVIDNHLYCMAYESGSETTSRVCLALKNGSGGTDIFCGVRSAAGSWSSLVEVGVTANGHTRPSLAIDKTNDEVYVFYIDSGTTSSVYYDKSDTGSLSFNGTDTVVLEDAAASDEKDWTAVPMHPVDSTSNLRICTRWNATNGGWNELSIAGVVGTTIIVPTGPWR